MSYPHLSPECRKCYNCGYEKQGVDGDSTEMPDTPFCGDFANPADNVVTCPREDCCASLKEYFIQWVP